MDSRSEPVILAAAPNGAYRTHHDHPALPVTPDEIVADALACHQAGAVMLHLHVRDPQGRHLLDADAYREVITQLDAAAGTGLVVQITTEAGQRYTPPEQMAVVRDVRPEAASVALRELVRSESDVPAYADFLSWAADAGVGVQHILYSPEDADRFAALRRRGVIPGTRPFLLFVLGTRHVPASTAAPLVSALAAVEADLHWMVCAFGRIESAAAVAAAALGGHARIGFENNLSHPDGARATSNADRIGRVRALLRSTGWETATADQVRALLTVNI